MQNADPIWQHVENHQDDLVGLSDRVWGMPETLYAEFRSCAEHTAMLRDKGFAVTEEIAGIPTAVLGEAGKGGAVIAILGEYDALPGLSQEANIAEPRPIEAGGNGHGCGHNLLGSAALLAACALKDWLEETGTPGRVRYYGCPAEEGGAAKAFMVRDGVFDDVDAAITWHPAGMTRVDEAASLANTRMDFEFTGRASHAAAAPHLGRSALDAAELMNVGVQYLREHIPQESRIHYAYLDAGGTAPNVVQGKAKTRYAIRSTSLSGMMALNERVRRIAEGAALMTETRVDISIMSAVSNMLGNIPLEETMQAAMDTLGGVPFDAADREYAAEIQATLSSEDIAANYKSVGLKARSGEPLCDYVVPLESRGDKMMGSTDVADVSWAVPTVQARVATHAIGTPGHSWQITAQGKAPAAHKGMIHAAKIMGATARMLFADDNLIARAKEDHQNRLTSEPYICPIPDDIRPPLKSRPAAD
ncbi:amidohydrolase [Nitratireductor aquimarinus]|uniref:amidohydrolase n=1 Tax=Nitratireductor TaxID=245876 RepID=UPI000DDEC9CE|nr:MULTISPECIES: amidohydrolase [Nitratireductor]MBN7776563.1 amidohydrolase [Nitratireductor pacificus]MBN7779430.1 amidohydrolase [Nitratireductor pacificus]MBN7788237.1 amidohydrolase [Nitratireductor aquimarinus]MBY6098284.1 amidohydrolase [Nitratireductor aquimarinus]MCA1259263.1 amidohydrolase [Nitratireductor aquimarinus]